MKEQSFNFEIKDLLTQFLAAFDDVVIKRYDANRVAKETIRNSQQARKRRQIPSKRKKMKKVCYLPRFGPKDFHDCQWMKFY